jgi:hypothetical protein
MLLAEMDFACLARQAATKTDPDVIGFRGMKMPVGGSVWRRP